MKATYIKYKVEISQLKPNINLIEYTEYLFKDLGYLILFCKSNKHEQYNYHGLITVSDLKLKLGEKQYSKFCQGKREFIISL